MTENQKIESKKDLVKELLDKMDFTQKELISIYNTIRYYRENFSFHDDFNNKFFEKQDAKRKGLNENSTDK